MKIAMPIWENHLSTVLDFSEYLVILDIEGEAVKEEHCINWSLCNDTMKVSLMKEEGVEVLLCGAVSRPLQIMVEDSGIHLIRSLRGRTDVILKAYLAGTLQGDYFRLPGSSMAECSRKNRECQNRKPQSGETGVRKRQCKSNNYME